jgi:hypothetical protein
MDRTADLSAALEFVIRRIEEEALRSGQPLNDEQHFLLNNLPKTASLPDFATSDPENPRLLRIPRDVNYERLCAAAKAAHRSDLELAPASLDWEFALVVSKLNRHPMRWLLQWAGVKQRRPWWDRWLLVGAALFFIACTMALMPLVVSAQANLFHWILFAAGYLAVILLMYFASRRIEEWQLSQNIERCRRASRFVGTM